MTDQKEPILDLETERSLNAQCLVLEMPGQTWHVPFKSLQGIPRVGEKFALLVAAQAKSPKSSMNSRLRRRHRSTWPGNARRRVIRATRPNCDQTVVTGTAGSFLSPKQLECASAHICHFGQRRVRSAQLAGNSS